MKTSLFMLVVALVTVSLLWASEEAYNGAGLQWVVLWCLAGLLSALHSLNKAVATKVDRPPEQRIGAECQSRVCLLDAGWLALALGQWVSTARLFWTGGDKRSAVNLSLEWLGLVIAWGLLRVAFRNTEYRRMMGTLMVAVTAGIATYGICQHHLIYPEQAAWYKSLRNSLDQLLESKDPTSFVGIAEKTAELERNGIPLTGIDRILWEQRLLNSSEPTGTFALANSLAGIVGFAIVVAVGCLALRSASGMRRNCWRSLLIVVVCLLCMTYCLILTKSRTAWVATIAGLAVIFAGRFYAGAITGRLRWVLASGMAVIMLAAGLALSTGALDKEVLLESPRSLQFRLLYWMGTLNALRDSPVFGFGPGNFRQAYLQHKLPESSEEIRDPHNLPLEAWSSGGLISLIGAIMCAVGWWKSVCDLRGRSAPSTSEPVRSAGYQSAGYQMIPGPLFWGCVWGFLLHGAWLWLQGRDLIEGWDLFLVIPVVSLLVCSAIDGRFIHLDSQVSLAAVCVLMVHLLGAGGFQMTGVMVVVAIGLAGSTTEAKVTAGSGKTGRPQAEILTEVSGSNRSGKRQRLENLTVSLASLIFCVSGLVTSIALGLLPVRDCDRYLAEASDQQISGNLRASITSLRKACEADPLAVTPRQRIAELESYRLSAAAGFTDQPGRAAWTEETMQLAESALAACQQLLVADPNSVVAWRILAANKQAIFQLTGQLEALEEGVRGQQHVVGMYPSSAEDWWTLSQMSSAGKSESMKETASAAARRALELDTVNHSWGHSDRYLTNEQVVILKQLGEIRRDEDSE